MLLCCAWCAALLIMGTIAFLLRTALTGTVKLEMGTRGAAGPPPRPRLASARGLLLAGLLVLATASSAYARSGAGVKQAQRSLQQVVSQPEPLTPQERTSNLAAIENPANRKLLEDIYGQVSGCLWF